MANTALVNTTFKIQRRFGFFNAAFTIAFCIAMACLFATTDTFAKDYSFTWSANPEPVEGYKLYYKKGGTPGAPFDGADATQGPSPITIGNQTTFTISGLDENATYYFALTAFNSTEESGFSNIVAVNVSSTDTTSPTPVPLTAVISPLNQSGVVPFELVFDGSQSTGAIINYEWTFGDGGTATASTVSHSYQTAGTYTATLTVKDGTGSTQQSSISITVTAPDPVSPTVPDVQPPPTDNDSLVDQTTTDETTSAPTTEEETQIPADTPTDTDDESETAVINFELQEVQANYNWKTVTFSQPFVDPVVVAGPPSFADAKPVTLRIRNVTSTGCQVRVDEYEYLRDRHATETFGIIIMEKGVYELDNGAKLEAGTFTGSTSFQKVVFQQTYNVVPVVLTQVLTYNEASAVSGRVRNSGVGSFDYALQEMEKNKVFHKAETVGYIAWEPGSGEYQGLLYEVGVTAQSVTDSWSEITFQSEFPSMPLFIAGMQTTAEADTAAVRRQNVSTTTARIKIEEETSKDAETSHAPEVVGYITIGSMP
jgi:chitodextrinase